MPVAHTMHRCQCALSTQCSEDLGTVCGPEGDRELLAHVQRRQCDHILEEAALAAGDVRVAEVVHLVFAQLLLRATARRE